LPNGDAVCASSARRNALAFARRGHRVVPLHWPVGNNGALECSCGSKRRDCPSPAKHPYGPFAPNGVLSATADVATVREWFDAKPEANYGVATDRELFALDIDPRNGGDESLVALERDHGPLPVTWRVITGSLGQHILFAAPDGLPRFKGSPNGKLGPGIDAPSYIVGAGSRHMSGRQYVWSVDHHPSDVPLAAPPAWLIDRLTVETTNGSSAEPHPPDFWQSFVAGGIREYRDAAAATVFGHLLRRYVEPRFAAGLLYAWNAAYCSPPLPEDELNKIIKRIGRRELARRCQP
jgi:hypothetical protein